MSNKQLDWSNLGFGYIQTDKRYVSNFKNGEWEEGFLTDEANVVLNECAGSRIVAMSFCEPRS